MYYKYISIFDYIFEHGNIHIVCYDTIEIWRVEATQILGNFSDLGPRG